MNMKLPYGATEENLLDCEKIVCNITEQQEVTQLAIKILEIIYAHGGDYSYKTIQAFAATYLNKQ